MKKEIELEFVPIKGDTIIDCSLEFEVEDRLVHTYDGVQLNLEKCRFATNKEKEEFKQIMEKQGWI